jgi:hypothetical protein
MNIKKSEEDVMILMIDEIENMILSNCLNYVVNGGHFNDASFFDSFDALQKQQMQDLLKSLALSSPLKELHVSKNAVELIANVLQNYIDGKVIDDVEFTTLIGAKKKEVSDFLTQLRNNVHS